MTRAAPHPLTCDRCGDTFQSSQGYGKHRRTCGITLVDLAAVLALIEQDAAAWERHAPPYEDDWTRIRYLAYADVLRATGRKIELNYAKIRSKS